MGKSLGLLELKSIPIGIQTADVMLKAADVELLLASPICPGKYIIIISGNVGPVKNAVQAGREEADTFLIGHHILNNVHDSLPSAVAGMAQPEKPGALGAVETISALAAVKAGDIAAKASNIRLIEIRIARGLGGKGYLLFTGEISSVKSALQSCQSQLRDTGEITSCCTIASPHPDLMQTLL